jgi:hypothetical protein
MQAIPQSCWDNACPAGVSYIEHLRSLQIRMVELYFVGGGKGVFVVHPMIAALLSVAEPLRFGDYEWSAEDPHVVAGHIGGIQVWTEPSIRGDEILVVGDHDDLQALGRLQIVNFVDVPEPLDRLAQI